MNTISEKIENSITILAESPHGWGGVWQRPHHLFRLLGERYPCYYVATRYLTDALRNRREYLRGRHMQPAPQLTVREIILFNGERLPFVRQWNIHHLARTLNTFSKEHASSRKVLWLYDPHQVPIIEHVPHDFLVYDIMDEYTGFPWSPPNVEAEERRLLGCADLVIAGTHSLYESKKKWVTRGERECILSAVDFEHFHAAARPGDIPDDLKEITSGYRHVAGYYGVVDMRIDVDLIIGVARRLPEWAFVFIGPLVGEKPRRLEHAGIPNIFLLGQRHYSELPEYTRGFDACMVPFVLDTLTRHINPTKVLEYFAAEKPVVTVPIPDILTFYKDNVFIAETIDVFCESLGHVAQVTDLTKQHIAGGVAAAREASWESAVQQIILHF